MNPHFPGSDGAAQVLAWQMARQRTMLMYQGMACMIMVVVFATALAPFVLSDQRNVLVILVAALSLPAIVMLRLPIGSDLGWSSAVIVQLLVVELSHGGTANFTSLGYTGMFLLAYVAFCGMLETGSLSAERLRTVLRLVVQAYALVSVAQFVFSTVGLPIPNHIVSKEGWSYNTLGVEPSHAARSLSFTLLSYLILGRRNGPATDFASMWRTEKTTLLAFATSLIFTGSSLAVAILPLTIVLALRLRWLMAGCLALILAWPTLQAVELESVRRLIAFLTALPSLDIMALVQADQSGALRVLPFIIFLQSASLGDASVWFGGGYEAIAYYVQGNLIGVAQDVAAAGFLPGYVMICGIFGTGVFMHAFLFRFINRQTLPLILLWIPILANCAWNSQIFWYSLMMLRAVYHFSQVPQPWFHPVQGRSAP